MTVAKQVGSEFAQCGGELNQRGKIMNMKKLVKDICLGRLIMMDREAFEALNVAQFLDAQGYSTEEIKPVSAQDFMRMARADFFTEVLLGRRMVIIDLDANPEMRIADDFWITLKKDRDIKLRYDVSLFVVYSKKNGHRLIPESHFPILMNSLTDQRDCETTQTDEWVHACIESAAKRFNQRVLGLTEAAALEIEKAIEFKGFSWTKALIDTAVEFLENQKITQNSVILARRKMMNLRLKPEKIEA